MTGNLLKCLRVVVLLGLTALLCVAGAQAATRYVSPSGSDTTGDGSLGNPWKTINYALGQMASGDTLYMRGGTYAERIGSGVIPSGTSEAVRTILQNYSGEAVTLQPLSGSGSGVVYLSGTQKYITIRGDAPHKVVLDAVNLNSAALYLGGSATAPSTYIRFENVEIKNAPSSGVLRGRYCEFISCKIHHNGSDNLDHGLYVSSHHNLVEGCEIYNNSGYGIQNLGVTIPVTTSTGTTGFITMAWPVLSSPTPTTTRCITTFSMTTGLAAFSSNLAGPSARRSITTPVTAIVESGST